MSSSRYQVQTLMQFAEALFVAAGLDAEKAQCVAEVLVTGDMVGQRTHGLKLATPYLDEIGKGLMTAHGDPEVVRDMGGTVVWDGNYLPGPWLVSRALTTASERIATHGVVTIVIRRSHHIACLASLIKRATDLGLAAILATSDPSVSFVAPFGGKEPLLTPNPIAIGYPGTRAPVWVDVSTSITTLGMARQKSATNTPFEHPWLMDADGNPTNDPHALDPGAGGSLLLLGGREYGHKGFGLSLMIEMLTQGLAGYGRQDLETRWSGNVFLQVIDPGAFAGREAFLRQMDFLTDRCHANAPIDPARPVRMPGEMVQQRIREAKVSGVELAPSIVEALAASAARLGVPMPAPLG